MSQFIPMRKRSLAEMLDYCAQDVLEHPGKYDAMTLWFLLGYAAERARELEAQVTSSDLVSTV